MTSWLLSLVLLLVAVSPHAAATPRPAYTKCGLSNVTYAANSTYEANLRRLAAALEAAASASQIYAQETLGFWANRVKASSFCRCGHYGGSCSCAACVAGAFRELQRSCPYHREAFFSDRYCTLKISEVDLLMADGSVFKESILKGTMASGLMFQVVGFAWLFFLLLQEWRGRKRGTAVLSAPLVDGDH